MTNTVGFAFAGFGAAATAASSGCGTQLNETMPQPGETKTINLNGRSFVLYLPESYKPNVTTKAYFSFHGQLELTGFTNSTLNNDSIAIFPDGVNKRWLTNIKANPDENNDFDFTSDMVNFIDQNLCIDRNRVYASGKSNGGAFTAALACNADVGQRFAAFASVSGAYYHASGEKGVGKCKHPKRPSGVPFLEFHGLNDTTAPYHGGGKGDKIPTRHMVGNFLEYNGCSRHDKGQVDKVPYHTTDKQGENVDTQYWHTTWDCPNKKGVVEHYKEGDMGHCWPSTGSNHDLRTHQDCPIAHYAYDATTLIIDFFAKHPREM
ncbi:ERAD-associated protein [Ascosphaera pollenicola]|nr:ERAD-associated protein [Ascosphaera pollenicola]